MDYNARYNEWMQFADEATRQELAGLSDAEREERFYTELEFGTAGLRGLLGAGTNRMNACVVRRATQGLFRYLSTFPGAKERGVAIAYDSRNYSDNFALEAALVLAANGCRVYLFESLRAVPQLSFTLRHLGCIAGIVITASHNPPTYNGYKVYWEHGGQVGPTQAEAIYTAMQMVEYFSIASMPQQAAQEAGLLQFIGRAEDEAYYAATESLLLHPELLREYGSKLNLVYTPLHGAGYVPVTAILRRVGVPHVHVVPEQAKPDGRFPTVAAPNPEDPNAFTLAIALAERVQADIILATDPDSDRLGVAVRKPDGAFIVLSGNQIGCLLLEYILSSLHASGKLPANALAVKSIVSTPLADAICARYGAEITDVLTGFRYISEIIDHSARTGEFTFLFGFEESYGFLAGGFSRDKDAICAAMLMAELSAACLAAGKTPYDALQELYAAYGFYKESVKSYTLEGKAGMEKIAAAMALLQVSPPQEIAGIRVRCLEDYSSRRRTCADGTSTPLSLPQTNMLRLLLEDDSWIIVRPSGTEPKLKLYIGANAPQEAALDARLTRLLAATDTLLQDLLGI